MYTIQTRLIHIHQCQTITWSNLYRILKVDPTLESLYHLTPTQLHKKFNLPLEKMKSLYNNLQSYPIDSMLEQYKCQNIQCLTLLDSLYPFSLKQIYDPPWVLYVKGNIEILNNKRILAIVGSRTPTSYGKNGARELTKALAHYNWVTVSGLAIGVDTIVHRTTLNNNGKTIAVLGSGLLHIYPTGNRMLAEEIAQNHLLISEYPLNALPQKWHFPARNRIISGLALGTLVIEAAEKSGSLITADLALAQNRDVFALPGPITSRFSIGTNQLIQRGAKLVQSVEDIFVEFEHLSL
ncbi:DNA-processing protein DprA [Bacillus salitolerans]|uniref:DNA-processing protein DprA n=1 Tax=Bacillus salitolerans TaxID=1437434 RepID=A0ABW4LM40_9BACI